MPEPFSAGDSLCSSGRLTHTIRHASFKKGACCSGTHLHYNRSAVERDRRGLTNGLAESVPFAIASNRVGTLSNGWIRPAVFPGASLFDTISPIVAAKSVGWS